MKNYERFIFVAFIAMTIFVEALIVSAPSDVSTSESEIDSSSYVIQELNSQEEASEKRKENFEKVLKEAGLKEDYDWYIENDLEEYIEGQWDGDDKKDDFYGKRYICGRMYYIFKSWTGLDGLPHVETYECNIDYSGHLEINGYSDECTFAVSKRNNIIYSWQYFECLDQWKIPNNETIVYYSPYSQRFKDDVRGFCETNDADGVKHLYSFLANGEMHKEY